MNILKKISSSITLITPLVACSTMYAQQKPNIIFFLVDDFGWSESSLPFGDKVYDNNLRFHTPNMERLAQKGVMMTNAYACPVSTPTRTSLMTGMNAAHMGITSFISLYKDVVPDAIGGHPGTTNENLSDIFMHPQWNYNALCPVSFEQEKHIYGLTHTLFATPMVSILRDEGYHTIHVGKAHWGPAGTPGANPYNMGFVVNIAGASNGHPKSYLPHDNFGNLPRQGDYGSVQNMSQYYGTNIHLTEALTREALKAIENPIKRKQPFYLYLSHYSNHTPIQPDTRFFQKYIDNGMDENEAKYASMVESMDKSLGDVLDFLESKNIMNNTVLIFYSDNGGHSVGNEKGGIPHTQNSPLREGKGSVYEGGIRVPMIFCWIGKIFPGTRISTPISCEDIFPTILDIAGVKQYTTVQKRDGQSLLKLITKGSEYVAEAKETGKIKNLRDAYLYPIPESISDIDVNRSLIFHYPHQLRFEDQNDIDFMSAIRQGEWKLVYRMHTFELELYNLLEDLEEKNNLAKQYPFIVKKMAQKLSEYLRLWNAPMPIIRSTGQRVPFPDEI